MRIRKIGTSVPLPSGQVIDSLNGSSTTNAPSIRAVNEGFGGKVLWTNSSPTSVFNQQTITLSSNDYNYLEFYFLLNNANNNNIQGSIKVLKGYGGRFYIGTFYRQITRQNDTTFDISNELGNNTNANLILYKVIGYK